MFLCAQRRVDKKLFGWKLYTDNIDFYFRARKCILINRIKDKKIFYPIEIKMMQLTRDLLSHCEKYDVSKAKVTVPRKNLRKKCHCLYVSEMYVLPRTTRLFSFGSNSVGR